MEQRQGTMANVGINPAFWRGKTVLVTGHTGFKGSWLSLLLQQLGARVVGYALAPPTQPSLFEIAGVADGMVSRIGDVRDADTLKGFLSAHPPEIVLHLAAQALVRHSYSNPVDTYATNVMGTINLLEAVRASGSVRCVVNVTTDKCYENREWLWGYRENEPMGGHDPYSNSKACSELVTAAYRNSFFQYPDAPSVATARAGNVIGGGDWARDRLIPDMLRAIAEGVPVRIRSPHAIRPWQHVMEPLTGYLLLAERLHQHGAAYAEAWNFGPREDDTQPVRWIVEHLTQQWGAGAAWELDAGEHPHEAHYLKLDCSKASMRLDWHPRWRLETAISQIVQWHKAQRAGQDMRAVTLMQMENYLNS